MVAVYEGLLRHGAGWENPGATVLATPRSLKNSATGRIQKSKTRFGSDLSQKILKVLVLTPNRLVCGVGMAAPQTVASPHGWPTSDAPRNEWSSSARSQPLLGQIRFVPCSSQACLHLLCSPRL
jgi:hypothetical protein